MAMYCIVSIFTTSCPLHYCLYDRSLGLTQFWSGYCCRRWEGNLNPSWKNHSIRDVPALYGIRISNQSTKTGNSSWSETSRLISSPLLHEDCWTGDTSVFSRALLTYFENGSWELTGVRSPPLWMANEDGLADSRQFAFCASPSSMWNPETLTTKLDKLFMETVWDLPLVLLADMYQHFGHTCCLSLYKTLHFKTTCHAGHCRDQICVCVFMVRPPNLVRNCSFSGIGPLV